MFKSLLQRFPALSLTGIAGLITAGLAVWQSANATGTTNWLLLAMGLVPLAAGALVHNSVVPVDTVRSIVANARTAAAAVTQISDKVDLEMRARPPEAG